MFSVLNCTQFVALRAITQARTYTSLAMKWKDEQYNSEERMGRHRDFLQSSEIGLAKDNFYAHENRRDGG